MKITLVEMIKTLFMKEKTHRLSVEKIYVELRQEFPDKDDAKLKHGIRRAIQTLYSRGIIDRMGQGLYVLKDHM